MEIKVQINLFSLDPVNLLFANPETPHISLSMEDAIKLRNLLLKEIPSSKHDIMEIELKHTKMEIERLHEKEYLRIIGMV